MIKLKKNNLTFKNIIIQKFKRINMLMTSIGYNIIMIILKNIFLMMKS